MEFLQPPGWVPPIGYANGVAACGRLVFVSGQVGWDAQRVFHAADLVGQVEQALRNIVAVLAEAGASPGDIVRLNWYLADRREYVARQAEIGEVYRRIIGRHYPAMTLLQVCGFVDADAQVEIEATAVVAEPAAGPTC